MAIPCHTLNWNPFSLELCKSNLASHLDFTIKSNEYILILIALQNFTHHRLQTGSDWEDSPLKKTSFWERNLLVCVTLIHPESGYTMIYPKSIMVNLSFHSSTSGFSTFHDPSFLNLWCSGSPIASLPSTLYLGKWQSTVVVGGFYQLDDPIWQIWLLMKPFSKKGMKFGCSSRRNYLTNSRDKGFRELFQQIHHFSVISPSLMT